MFGKLVDKAGDPLYEELVVFARIVLKFVFSSFPRTGNPSEFLPKWCQPHLQKQ